MPAKRALTLAGRGRGEPFAREGWLPFLDVYRTMLLAPGPDLRRVLENVRELGLAA